MGRNRKRAVWHKGVAVVLFTCLCFALLSATPVSAATETVNTFGALQTALLNENTTEIIVTAAIALPNGTVIDGKGKTVRAPVTGTNAAGITNAGATDINIFTVASGATVSISNLTILGGAKSAISNRGTLTLTSVNLMQSGSASAIGGGINNAGTGKALLKQCRIMRNIADYGGGFLNGGTLVFDGCTISENRNIGDGAKGGGGGQNNSTLYAVNTTFANNQSSEIGGAINNFGGTIYAGSCAITGNLTTDSSATAGGGIGNNNGTVYLVNSIAMDNYYNANNSGNSLSDIGFFSGIKVSAFYSIYGVSTGTFSSSTDTRQLGSTADVFNRYVDTSLLDKNGNSGGNNFRRPALVGGAPLLSASSAATTGGTNIYFEYNAALTDIRFGYGPDGNNITKLTTNQPAATALVTTYQDGTARAAGVVGPVGPTSDIYYTVALLPSANGSCAGASVFGDTYKQGETATVSAEPNSGYWFEKWEFKKGVNKPANLAIPVYAFQVTEDVTLQPVFKAKPAPADVDKYQLLFDANYPPSGARAGACPPTTYPDISDYVLVPANPGMLTCENHAFSHWNTQADGLGTSYAGGSWIQLIYDSPITLYAQWTNLTNDERSLTYDANFPANTAGFQSGTAPADVKNQLVTTVTLADKGDLACAGYTFGGWNSAADGTGKTTQPGELFDLTQTNNTVYALWVPLTRTVTYNGNGSTGGSVPAAQSGTGLSYIVAGNSFTRTGYTFAGWNTAASGTGGTAYAVGSTYTFGLADNTAATLYAQWSPNANVATLTYDANCTGFTGAKPSDQKNAAGTLAVTVSGNGTLARAGYDFDGWNTLADGSGDNYAAGSTITLAVGSNTLYAKWKIRANSSTLQYNANAVDATGTPPSDQKNGASSFNVTVAGAGTLARTNYTFAGWNTAANGSGAGYTAGSTYAITPGGTETLYARWTLNADIATLTYNANGATAGSVPNEQKNAAGSLAVTMSDNTGSLVRDGYVFGGWNTLANGSGADYAANGSMTLSIGANILYAKWDNPQPNTRWLAYSGNGADGGGPIADTKNGATATVSVATNTFTRTEYVFTGWNTAADGSGTDYLEGANFVLAAAGETMLYAQWEIESGHRTLTYDDNDATGGSAPAAQSNATGSFDVTVSGNTGSLVKTGFLFAGWNTQADGLGNTYAANSTYALTSATNVLYAKWDNPQPNTRQLVYDGNGASSGVAPDATFNGSTATVSVAGNTGATPLHKLGMVFAGWSTAADGTGTVYQPGEDLILEASVTRLYAVWKNPPAGSRTLLFDANGATRGNAPSAISNGVTATVTLPGNIDLARDGFTFAGWNTAADGSGKMWQSGDSFVLDRDSQTLYAIWSLKPGIPVTGDTGGIVAYACAALLSLLGMCALLVIRPTPSFRRR